VLAAVARAQELLDAAREVLGDPESRKGYGQAAGAAFGRRPGLASLAAYGKDTALGLLEFDPDGVVAALINVLDRVRALRFHPAHAHGGQGCGVLRGLELQGPARVIPDPGWLVDDHHAGRPVRVLGFAGARLDHYFQYPYPVVLQKDTV
jgi:hypothetical protein